MGPATIDGAREAASAIMAIYCRARPPRDGSLLLRRGAARDGTVLPPIDLMSCGVERSRLSSPLRTRRHINTEAGVGTLSACLSSALPFVIQRSCCPLHPCELEVSPSPRPILPSLSLLLTTAVRCLNGSALMSPTCTSTASSRGASSHPGPWGMSGLSLGGSTTPTCRWVCG